MSKRVERAGSHTSRTCADRRAALSASTLFCSVSPHAKRAQGLQRVVLGAVGRKSAAQTTYGSNWCCPRSGACQCTMRAGPTPPLQQLCGVDGDATLRDDVAEEALGGRQNRHFTQSLWCSRVSSTMPSAPRVSWKRSRCRCSVPAQTAPALTGQCQQGRRRRLGRTWKRRRLGRGG